MTPLKLISDDLVVLDDCQAQRTRKHVAFRTSTQHSHILVRSPILCLLLGSVVLGTLSATVVAAELALDDVRTVVPGAERVGAVEGSPPAAPVFQGERLVGFVFHSNAAVQSAGYTGKPIDVLVGLGTDGVIKGARILEHHEPILAIGVNEDVLRRFVDSHRGLDIARPVAPARRREGESGPDVISGATVSSLFINDTIVRSARAVARSRGFLGAGPAGAIDLDLIERATWAELVADGSIAHGRLERAPPGSGGSGPVLISDLNVTLAAPPRIGRNLLGDKAYVALMAEHGADDALILIAGNGLYSFKGTAFTRTGEFDRIRIIQDGRTFSLRSDQHRRIDGFEPGSESPAFREIGLFILPRATGFDSLRGWTLELHVSSPMQDQPDTTLAVPYRLPQRYLRAAPPSQPVADAEPSRRSRALPSDSAPPKALQDAVESGLLVLSGLVIALVGGLAAWQSWKAAS